MQDPNDLRIFCDKREIIDARNGCAHGSFGSIVCDHDQRYGAAFGTAMLNDSFDADADARKERGYLSQYARSVIDCESTITTGVDFIQWNKFGIW